MAAAVVTMEKGYVMLNTVANANVHNSYFTALIEKDGKEWVQLDRSNAKLNRMLNHDTAMLDELQRLRAVEAMRLMGEADHTVDNDADPMDDGPAGSDGHVERPKKKPKREMFEKIPGVRAPVYNRQMLGDGRNWEHRSLTGDVERQSWMGCDEPNELQMATLVGNVYTCLRPGLIFDV